MLVIQSTQPSRSMSGTAASAPTPINTPSLRKESLGKDLSNQGGNPIAWGSSASSSQPSSSDASNPLKKLPSTSSLTSPAPWAKPAATAPSVAPTAGQSKPGMKNWADVESDEESDPGLPRTLPSAPVISNLNPLSSNHTPFFIIFHIPIRYKTS